MSTPTNDLSTFLRRCVFRQISNTSFRAAISYERRATMGVPKFYRWISERYPCLSEVISENRIPEFDNLYLDMNGIIHACTHPNDDDPDFYLEEHEMFQHITEYIAALFRIIRPKRTFFMAVDGVAPRAKMNQQRARRFTSAKNAEKLNEKAEQPNKARFDSNVITPGTSFMVRLHEHLKYFVHAKMSTDPMWRGVRVILSGHDCPGEGEHKIMDFIRHERSRPGYDAETRHCMYGLDADLIMLGLCSHEPHFSLLREEVRFGRPSKKQKGAIKAHYRHKPNVDEITFHLLHLSLLRGYLEHEFDQLKSGSYDFNLEGVIDDWVLMGFLVGNDFIPNLPHMHIAQNALPIMYKAYKNVAPNMGGYINEKGYLNLRRFGLFLEELAKYDMRNFEQCAEDMDWLESKKQTSAVEKSLAEMTFDSDDDFDADEQALETERISAAQHSATDDEPALAGAFDTSSDESSEHSGDETAQQRRVAQASSAAGLQSASQLLGRGALSAIDQQNDVLDDTEIDEQDDELAEPQWTRQTHRKFKRHKRNYYRDKLEFSNITTEQLREQATGYVRAIQWNLHYYYHGCASWSWHYRFHYAPYLSDVRHFADIDLHFDLGTPFNPFEQLLAVLPPASRHALPQPYHPLMIDSGSPIIDFYPTEFACDLNGKQQEWEAVVLIPFIDEERLLAAMRSVEHKLSPEERARNGHRPHLEYRARAQPHKGDKRPVASPDPVRFPHIDNTLAEVTEFPMKAFWVPREKIIHGLVSRLARGTDRHKYLPGFPTLAHVTHTAYLSMAGVRVFNMSSRNESMMLEVAGRDDTAAAPGAMACDATAERPSINLVDTDELARTASDRLVGSVVHVDWPFLRTAQVVGLSTKRFSVEVPDSYLLGQTEVGQSIERTLRAAAQPRRVDAPQQHKQWQRAVDDYSDHLRERYGIVLPRVDLLVWVRHLLGTRLSVDRHGKVARVHQWAESRSPVAYDLLVCGVTEQRAELQDGATPIDQLFPVGDQVFVIGSDLAHYGCLGEVIKPWNPDTRRFEVRVLEQEEPVIEDIMTHSGTMGLHWYPGYRMARECSLTTQILSRITGSVLVEDSKENKGKSDNKHKRGERDRNKVNVGLKLKSIKRNEECADYTRKDADGQWLYSTNVYDLIQDYYAHFPEVFDYMSDVDASTDVYDCQSMFSASSDPGARLTALKDYLGNIPTASIKRQTAGAQTVDGRLIAAIERRVDIHVSQMKRAKHKTVRLGVIASALYKPSLCVGHARAEPSADFQLLDRVVNVRPGFSVPLGLRGFVIGLHPGQSDAHLMLDVIFDESFLGGTCIRSTRKSCYKLPASALLNRSWCRRAAGVSRRGSAGQHVNGKAAGESTDKPATERSAFDKPSLSAATRLSETVQPAGQWNNARSTDQSAKGRVQRRPQAGTVTFTKSGQSPLLDEGYGRPPMVVLCRQQPPVPPTGFGENSANDGHAAAVAYAALKSPAFEQRMPQPPPFMPPFAGALDAGQPQVNVAHRPPPFEHCRPSATAEDESTARLKSLLHISSDVPQHAPSQQQKPVAPQMANQAPSPETPDDMQPASAYHYDTNWNDKLGRLCQRFGLPSADLLDQHQLFGGRYIATISLNGYKFKSRAKQSSEEAAQSAAREAYEALRSMSPSQIAQLQNTQRHNADDATRRYGNFTGREDALDGGGRRMQRGFEQNNWQPPPLVPYDFGHSPPPLLLTGNQFGPMMCAQPPGAYGRPPPPLMMPTDAAVGARYPPPGAFVPLQALRQQLAHSHHRPATQPACQPPVAAPAANQQQPPSAAQRLCADGELSRDTSAASSGGEAGQAADGGGTAARQRRKRQSRLALNLSAK